MALAEAHSPALAFALGEWRQDDRQQMRCPKGCWDDNSGVQYVHPMFERVEIHRNDRYGSPTGEQGEWLRLPFWCEGCGTGDVEAFALIFAFHKGQTFVSLVLYA